MRDVRELVSTNDNRPSDDVDLDEVGLPFDTPETLQNFDKQLADSDFRRSMVYHMLIASFRCTLSFIFY